MDGAEQQQHDSEPVKEDDGAAATSAAGNGDHRIDAAERRRRWRSAWWVVGIACMLGLAVIGAKWVNHIVVLHRNKQCEGNLRIAQGAIERYVLTNLSLPEPIDLEQVFSAQPNQYSFISGRAIVNPFTGKQVRLVSYSAKSAGEITYIPIPSDQFSADEFADWSESPVGYYLIAYGKDLSGYADIDGDGKGDGVRLILQSEYRIWRGPSRFFSSAPLTDPPPQLDTAWKAIQWAEGQQE